MKSATLTALGALAFTPGLIGLAGCGSPAAPAAIATTRDAGEIVSTASTQPTATPISFTIGDTVVTAELDDNPTTRDLLAQLPLTLTIKDYNHVEKTAVLPKPLDTQNVPRGADPELFEIGYYTPNQVLVLYYGDVGFFTGIVRLGRFNPANADLIENQPDDTIVTITAI